jgi:hypothetical protein
MKKIALVAAGLAIALPASAEAANRGAVTASQCGVYHGMFALPAHGFLKDFVPVFAKNGDYKGGTVGDRASNPICH